MLVLVVVESANIHDLFLARSVSVSHVTTCTHTKYLTHSDSPRMQLQIPLVHCHTGPSFLRGAIGYIFKYIFTINRQT